MRALYTGYCENTSRITEDRIHDALAKDTPNQRPIENRPSPTATVVSSARLGGLHHRYSWREAA
jgi:hypothetical protein